MRTHCKVHSRCSYDLTKPSWGWEVKRLFWCRLLDHWKRKDSVFTSVKQRHGIEWPPPIAPFSLKTLGHITFNINWNLNISIVNTTFLIFNKNIQYFSYFKIIDLNSKPYFAWMAFQHLTCFGSRFVIWLKMTFLFKKLSKILKVTDINKNLKKEIKIIVLGYFSNFD